MKNVEQSNTANENDATQVTVEHHSWCDDTYHHIMGSEFCSSHLVDFTSSKPDDDSVPEAGWWGWLAARSDDDLVSLVMEGRPLWADESWGTMSFEVPVWRISALRDVLGDDRGRQSLHELLSRIEGTL